MPATKTRKAARTEPVAEPKMSLAEAAELFERGTVLAEEAKALKARAEAVLKPWFEKTGRREWEGRIEATATGGQLTLDSDKVKAFLGTRLAEFQKRATRGLSLRVIRKD